MNVDELRRKVEKVRSCESSMDNANGILRELEESVRGLNRSVCVSLGEFIDSRGTNSPRLEYRRGLVMGKYRDWGLFIHNDFVAHHPGTLVDKKWWYWSVAPGALRVQAAMCRDDFLKAAAEVADNVIAELPH